jgi:hydroxymethylpyrimidine kinase/phosphomethylpyrimidine kinase
MKPKRILSIAGSDSGGGAGIQADLKTITVLGGFGMSVITALTAQNTLGVLDVHEVPPEFVMLQFDAVASDIGIDAAKTGMMANSSIIRAVAAKIRQYQVGILVVDPVMVAKGGRSLIHDEAKETLIRELVPLAFLITPNIPEAEELAGFPIKTVVDMKQAAEVIQHLGARSVLVKGGHLAGDATDVLYDGTSTYEFTSPRIETKDTHGTGCTYSAAIATILAQGKTISDAVRDAKVYITEAVRHAHRIGAGHGPTNHLAPILNSVYRKDV